MGELLPCPFCGGEAFRRPTMRQFGNPAECRGCGAVGPDPLIPVSWNTRAALPAASSEEIAILRTRVEDQATEIARLTRIVQMQPPRDGDDVRAAIAAVLNRPQGPEGEK